MSFSEITLIIEIASITILGFWATNLRKKNKAKFLKLNLHTVKNLREKDLDLNNIKNILRLEENDPEYMKEAQLEMLQKLGVDVEALQREAIRVKKEEEEYDNDPTVSEDERIKRRLARLEEREKALRDRELRDDLERSRSNSSSSSSSDSSSSSGSDSSSGGGGGFDGGGAGAGW